MKTISKFLLVLLGTCSLVKADVFVQPEVSFNSIRNDHFSAKTGGGISMGYEFGAESSHLIGIRYSNFQWSYSDLPPPDLYGTSAREGAGRFEPIMIGYRYQLGKMDSRVRPYAGVWGGVTRITGDIGGGLTATQYIVEGAFREWNPSALGEAGLVVNLRKGVSIDLGCRLLRASRLKPTIMSVFVQDAGRGYPISSEFDMGSIQVIQGTVGLKFSF